jgi:hypothetical protein
MDPMKTLRLLAVAAVVFHVTGVDAALPWLPVGESAGDAGAKALFAASTLALGLVGMASLAPGRR